MVAEQPAPETAALSALAIPDEPVAVTETPPSGMPSKFKPVPEVRHNTLKPIAMNTASHTPAPVTFEMAALEQVAPEQAAPETVKPVKIAASVPAEQVTAEVPEVEPVAPQPASEPASRPASEPAEDGNLFQALFGLFDNDDTQAAGTTPVTTPPVQKQRDRKGVQHVSIPLPVTATQAIQEPEPELEQAKAMEPEPEVMVEANPVSEPGPETVVESKPVPAPEPETVVESEPDPEPAPLLPMISRRGPEPTIVDAVAAFFGGSTEPVHQRPASPEDDDPMPASQPSMPTDRNDDGEEGSIQIARQTTSESPQQSAIVLASIADGVVNTPLVDAAIEQGQGQTIDRDDPGFIVNVPVPASDHVTLTEDKLMLGVEGNLGRALPFADDPGKHCVRRLSGKTWVCLESLGWPSVIADAFKAKGVPEGRTPAIIRYDNQAATQYRVSFPADSYDRIMFHFLYLLGEPTARSTVMVPIFANPKQASRVTSWIAEPKSGMRPAVLELREIDDVRWMETPDTRNGVVRLYRQGMKPVFSLVMSGDLRLIEMRRIGTDTPEFATAPE